VPLRRSTRQFPRGFAGLRMEADEPSEFVTADLGLVESESRSGGARGGVKQYFDSGAEKSAADKGGA